jgi:transcription antitermination factor NusG
VLQTAGVVSFIGNGRCGVPIPDKQIEDIQIVLTHRVPCAIYPFLRVGQRVRIRGGCLDGIEGLLIAFKGDRTLVISVESILQSLAIRIEGYNVEILSSSDSVRKAS